MRAHFALVAALAAAHAALAHDVPVNPSGCTCDPVQLTAPGAGISATLAAAGTADAMRVVYSVATSTAQFQQRIPAPRAFTIGGVPGTITLPQAFDARFAASGDLDAGDVAIALTLAGASATVPVTLSTAIVTAGADVATGIPMDTDGRFMLVGAMPAGSLPPPLDTASTLLRLSCRASPAPDLDQFTPASALESLAGVVSASGVKLRGVLRTGSLAASAVQGGPAILHLAAGGAQVLTVELAGGFVAAGSRKLVARSADGGEMTLRLGRGRAPARLQAVLPGAGVPADASGQIQVQATLVAGRLTARGSRPFRARRGTLRAGS